ncbi:MULTISPECIES: MerR family transcriptional regulator [unclassified Curtobacterium]|uniref:MerR family transcriptional regulator n=1 Tax=unclassified Curtobacterium TaxID=257496 RepID=UPI000DAA5CEE|nr:MULTISPECIES: MerR family transcriptional regulator [unclassified Curtobacterium]PZE24010.1 MerR family transcriptional regulator [Curtobacterium sp. MCBD17_028]PZE73596.1 MerR family transcriptional regulator [Curtobacterium sp. MCBD17_019]PZF56870.1 MerR family transcriptional regulator [Curtobacterium sp. MCBD17_034]PZF60611.1 MerR family transcriptional regulator [Curtobacterium sp. MCBD17_013]PZM33826.1 MerR family transcriptional regulator [Curtobacterium sp. MCBD17_031]
MNIGELSARSGVSARSLRYYEQQGLLSARRSPNGYRTYTDDAVEKARVIRTMFEIGFSREDVRAVIPCATGRHDTVDRRAVRGTVERMRDDMSERIDELVRTRAALTEFLERGV